MRQRRKVVGAGLLALALVSPRVLAETLIPGPGESAHDDALLQKMKGFERQVHGILTVPLGWGLEAFVPVSERSLVESFIASQQHDFQAATGKHPYEVVSHYEEYGDLGMFGGVQAAGDAFRYMVLRDEKAPAADVDRARADLLRAMQGLHWYQRVTGVPGVVARGLRRIQSEPGQPPLPGPTVAPVPLFDGSGNPQPEPKEPTWRADASGELPFLIWLDDTSKDQVDGYVFALGAVYDAAKDDPSIPAQALTPLVEDARAFGLELMKKHEFIGKETDLVLVDADGRPTTFHDLSAEEATAGLVLDSAVNGFNAIMSLGIVRTLFHITGDERIGRFYYEELVGRRDYLGSIDASVSLMYLKEQTNFSNVNMAFVAAYGLLRYESDLQLAGRIREILEQRLYAPGVSRQAKGLKQSFFDFIYAGFRTGGTSGEGAQARKDGIETLQELRSAPFWNDAVDNCDAAEIAALSCQGVDGTPITLSDKPGRGGSVVATAPIPMRIRPPSNFEWRSDPHAVNGGGGERLNPGAEFVTAYWLGRLLEAGSLGVANISPHARAKDPGWGGSAGAGGMAGNGGASAKPDASDAGCGCHAAPTSPAAPALVSLLLLGLLASRRSKVDVGRTRSRNGWNGREQC
ncbi:MAG: MYXO-CTERM sorting domain-containing protein [Polyangiaceae bacterium]